MHADIIYKRSTSLLVMPKYISSSSSSSSIKFSLFEDLAGNPVETYKRYLITFSHDVWKKRTFPPLRNKLEGKPLAAQPQPYTIPGTSYSAALTSQQQYETATSSIQQIPTQQQQIHPQPSEIHELKTMMKRLMEQMSTMLHLLTTVVSKMT